MWIPQNLTMIRLPEDFLKTDICSTYEAIVNAPIDSSPTPSQQFLSPKRPSPSSREIRSIEGDTLPVSISNGVHESSGNSPIPVNVSQARVKKVKARKIVLSSSESSSDESPRINALPSALPTRAFTDSAQHRLSPIDSSDTDGSANVRIPKPQSSAAAAKLLENRRIADEQMKKVFDELLAHDQSRRLAIEGILDEGSFVETILKLECDFEWLKGFTSEDIAMLKQHPRTYKFLCEFARNPEQVHPEDWEDVLELSNYDPWANGDGSLPSSKYGDIYLRILTLLKAHDRQLDDKVIEKYPAESPWISFRQAKVAALPENVHVTRCYAGATGGEDVSNRLDEDANGSTKYSRVRKTLELHPGGWKCFRFLHLRTELVGAEVYKRSDELMAVNPRWGMLERAVIMLGGKTLLNSAYGGMPSGAYVPTEEELLMRQKVCVLYLDSAFSELTGMLHRYLIDITRSRSPTTRQKNRRNFSRFEKRSIRC